MDLIIKIPTKEPVPLKLKLPRGLNVVTLE